MGRGLDSVVKSGRASLFFGQSKPTEAFDPQPYIVLRPCSVLLKQRPLPKWLVGKVLSEIKIQMNRPHCHQGPRPHSFLLLRSKNCRFPWLYQARRHFRKPPTCALWSYRSWLVA
jgi:hypothetical protein